MNQDKRRVVIKLGQLNKIEDLQVIVENLEEKEVCIFYLTFPGFC